MTEKLVWHVVKEFATKIGVSKLAPHDLRRSCARLCRAAGGELEQIQFLLGSRLGANYRALPRLHPADFIRRERPHRHRAKILNGQLWKGCRQPPPILIDGRAFIGTDLSNFRKTNRTGANTRDLPKDPAIKLQM